jgi:hypothetical protein
VSATDPGDEGLRLQSALETRQDRRVRRDVSLSSRLLQQGDTIGGALDNIREAIELCLDGIG